MSEIEYRCISRDGSATSWMEMRPDLTLYVYKLDIQRVETREKPAVCGMVHPLSTGDTYCTLEADHPQKAHVSNQDNHAFRHTWESRYGATAQ